MTDKDTGPIGTAICGSCGTRGDVFYTEAGMRCDTCRTQPTDRADRETFSPELCDYEDTRDEELASNVKEFNEELPEIGFDVEMQDGSTWEMDKFDTHAVLLKYGDDWEAFLHALAQKVAEHFEKETEPTKFASYAPWGSSNHDASQTEYENHAELAPVVAYSDLRSAKMQLAFLSLSDDDEDPVNVIGIGDGKITEYGEHGRVTVEYDDDAEFNFDDGGDD